MTKIRVGINGFGRIGRTLTRILIHHPNIEVVAVNDIADITTLAHLFKYDSIHGKLPFPVSLNENILQVLDSKITFSQEKEPSNIPWKKAEVDVVIEATGFFKTKELALQHLAGGAKKVILSAPPEDDTSTIVIGVNDKLISGNEQVISNASCTTNNAAPMIAILDELCEIESCYITTVHSYTTDQKLHDAPHKDLRRGRAAAQSIVPTTTGAAKALTKIFPHLQLKIGGCGIRVPVPDGSLTDITCVVKNPVDAEKINAVFLHKSENEYKRIMEYCHSPIVSSDVIGNKHSCLFDPFLTSVIGQMVKIVGWYDNEMGYSHRIVDLIGRLRV